MNDRELAVVLAALRYFQQHRQAAIAAQSDHFLEVPVLTDDELDRLCARMNGAAHRPRVIVVVEGGNVQAIYADQPLNVEVLDHDNWSAASRVGDPHYAPRVDKECTALVNEIDGGELTEVY